MKKLAFFRQTNPFGLGLAVRALNELEADVLPFPAGVARAPQRQVPAPTLCRSGPLFVAGAKHSSLLPRSSLTT